MYQCTSVVLSAELKATLHPQLQGATELASMDGWIDG